jgi:hypothetical protein
MTGGVRITKSGPCRGQCWNDAGGAARRAGAPGPGGKYPNRELLRAGHQYFLCNSVVCVRGASWGTKSPQDRILPCYTQRHEGTGMHRGAQGLGGGNAPAPFAVAVPGTVERNRYLPKAESLPIQHLQAFAHHARGRSAGNGEARPAAPVQGSDPFKNADGGRQQDARSWVLHVPVG